MLTPSARTSENDAIWSLRSTAVHSREIDDRRWPNVSCRSDHVRHTCIKNQLDFSARPFRGIPTSRVDCRLGSLVQILTCRTSETAFNNARPSRGFGLLDNPTDPCYSLLSLCYHNSLVHSIVNGVLQLPRRLDEPRALAQQPSLTRSKQQQPNQYRAHILD